MNDHTRISRRLSYILRHRPDSVGLELDPHGWTDIAHLLGALRTHGVPLDRAGLDAIVAGNDKQRFEISGARIRARQGHSVTVDLDLAAATPPDRLYHGTARRFLPAIMTGGLRPGSRHHVHLSPDTATATTVGTRRDSLPAVLTVDSAAMTRDGYTFHVTGNGVWLTAHVPARYLTARSPST